MDISKRDAKVCIRRMVVGWQMADHMRTELIEDALRMAHRHGHIQPGAIFHSDRGAQYTSADFADTAKSLRVRLSVGRTGSCHDNAVAESWFSMLKNQLTPAEQAKLLIANLVPLEPELQHGIVVSLGHEHFRVRRLPLR